MPRRTVIAATDVFPQGFRDYQYWEEGSHPQLIENEQALRKKLEHIHQNPVKWGYVAEPVH